MTETETYPAGASPPAKASHERTSAKTIAAGGLWSLSSTVATLIASFAATPFVLRGMGPETYGVFSLIQVVVGYFAFADVGMGDASTRFSADAYARGDTETEVAVIWGSLVVEAVPSLGAAVTMILGARYIVVDLLAIPGPAQAAAIAAFPVAAVAFAAKGLATIFNSPQMVRFRFRNVALINSFCGVAQLSLVPIVVVSGGSLAMCVAVIAGANLLNLVLHAIYACRLLPGILRPRIRLPLLASLARYGGWMVVVMLAATVLAQTEKVLVSRFASPSALAYYTVAFSLAGMIAIVPRAAKNALFPAFSRLQAGASQEPMVVLYGQIVRGALLCVGPVVVISCVLARPFFTIWAGPEYGAHSTLPFYILTGGFVAMSMAHIPTVLLKGIGRVDLIARLNLIEIVPYIAAVVFLTKWWGAPGAAVAFALRVMADAALCFLAVRKLVPTRIWPDPRHARRFVGAMLVLAIPLGTLPFASVPLSARFVLMVAALTAYFAAVWTKVLTAEERTVFAALGRKVLRGRAA